MEVILYSKECNWYTRGCPLMEVCAIDYTVITVHVIPRVHNLLIVKVYLSLVLISQNFYVSDSSYYNISSDSGITDQFLTRTLTGKKKTLYLTSPLVQEITKKNEKDCKVHVHVLLSFYSTCMLIYFR